MKNLPNILKEAKSTRERLDYEARLINHPAQDMADPKNWREGDVVECLVDGAGGYSCFECGQRLRIVHCWVDGSCDVDTMDGRFSFGLHFFDTETNQLKWISR